MSEGLKVLILINPEIDSPGISAVIALLATTWDVITAGYGSHEGFPCSHRNAYSINYAC